MKKTNSIDNHGGMKLRSGKVLSNPNAPPELLINELNKRLNAFKQAFADKPEFAQELLIFIGHSKGMSSRIGMVDMIEEAYNDVPKIQLTQQYSTAGSLLSFINGRDLTFYHSNYIEPVYNKFIQDTIDHYDLEMPLIGDMN